MGLLDHRRTWHYEVSAPPTDCIQAFVATFKGRAGLGAKAKWSVRTGSDSATATYEGRQGLGGGSRIPVRDSSAGKRHRDRISGNLPDRQGQRWPDPLFHGLDI